MSTHASLPEWKGIHVLDSPLCIFVCLFFCLCVARPLGMHGGEHPCITPSGGKTFLGMLHAGMAPGTTWQVSLESLIPLLFRTL